jgi:hypothetical protein
MRSIWYSNWCGFQGPYGGKSMQAHPKTHDRVRLNRSGSVLQKCGSKGRDAGPRNVMKSGGILAIPSMFVDVLPVESWNPSIARSNGWRVKLGGLNPGIPKAFGVNSSSLTLCRQTKKNCLGSLFMTARTNMIHSLYKPHHPSYKYL